MAKVDIWMPIYIGDYLRDTEELTCQEHGAYLLLLMHYWQKKGEIGSDIERLARVCKSSVETCSFVLGYYFTLENESYKNKRADEEMAKAEKRRVSRSENGKLGGRPPKITETEPTENLQLSARFTETKAKKSSSSSSLPIQIQEEVHTYLEVGGMGEGENEEKKCVPKKSNPKPKDQETTHVLDGYEYRSAVRIEWDKLGDKVYIAPDPILFENTWRDISPCIKGIHSDDVIQAIKNFGTIINGPPGKYWWTARISIKNFFQKHVEKFLPTNFREEDFLSRDYSPSLEERLAEIHAEEAERATARNVV